MVTGVNYQHLSFIYLFIYLFIDLGWPGTEIFPILAFHIAWNDKGMLPHMVEIGSLELFS
jgi:hypothetical protein